MSCHLEPVSRVRVVLLVYALSSACGDGDAPDELDHDAQSAMTTCGDGEVHVADRDGGATDATQSERVAGDDAASAPDARQPSDASVADAQVMNTNGDAGFASLVGVCAYKTQDFPRIAALGVKHVRMDRPTAATIELARSHGIEVLPIADYGDADLSGGKGSKYPPLPEHRATWAKRMIDLWRGMKQPPPAIEVWNEPWLKSFWPDAPDAPAYLALVKALATEAWSAWPNTLILVSADRVSSTPNYFFIDELLKADRDGFLNDPRIHPATHNYVEARTPSTVTGDACSWDLDRYACAYDAFQAHGHPDPQVWVTEFGWESDTPKGTMQSPVSEAKQAEYTKAALQLFQRSGKVTRAYAFMFNYDDKWNYNWLRPDNTQKPVCAEVKQLIATGR